MIDSHRPTIHIKRVFTFRITDRAPYQGGSNTLTPKALAWKETVMIIISLFQLLRLRSRNHLKILHLAFIRIHSSSIVVILTNTKLTSKNLRSKSLKDSSFPNLEQLNQESSSWNSKHTARRKPKTPPMLNPWGYPLAPLVSNQSWSQ